MIKKTGHIIFLILLLYSSKVSAQSDFVVNINQKPILDQFEKNRFELYSSSYKDSVFNLRINWTQERIYIGTREVPQYEMTYHDFKYVIKDSKWGLEIVRRKSFEKKITGKRYALDSFTVNEINILQPEGKNIKFVICDNDLKDTVIIGTTKLTDLKSKTILNDQIKISANTIMIKYNIACRLFFKKKSDDYVLEKISFVN